MSADQLDYVIHMNNLDADRRDRALACAKEIFDRYMSRYDGEIQGCCPLIADEIERHFGGEVVAGELVWPGCRRTHWWVELDGVTIDPMGDNLLSYEEWGEREEAHRDRKIFLSILPEYERWRI